MQIIHIEDTYTYLLNEAEWYGLSNCDKNRLADMCKGAAMDRGCHSVAILVNPDPFLSISPKPRRHRVWHYVAPTSLEEDFRLDLADLRRDALKAGMTYGQIAIIANEVFS